MVSEQRLHDIEWSVRCVPKGGMIELPAEEVVEMAALAQRAQDAEVELQIFLEDLAGGSPGKRVSVKAQVVSRPVEDVDTNGRT